MSILQQQLTHVAWAKEKLFAQGYSADDQEAAFQEDMFFPKSAAELDSAKYAVKMQLENKQFDQAQAKKLDIILTKALELYKLAPKELLKDRRAKAAAEAEAAAAIAKAAETGGQPVVETANVKGGKKGWLSKGNNKWWLIGGLAVLATTITIIAVVRSRK
jgi:hypothetical protein